MLCEASIAQLRDWLMPIILKSERQHLSAAGTSRLNPASATANKRHAARDRLPMFEFCFWYRLRSQDLRARFCSTGQGALTTGTGAMKELGPNREIHATGEAARLAIDCLNRTDMIRASMFGDTALGNVKYLNFGWAEGVFC